MLIAAGLLVAGVALLTTPSPRYLGAHEQLHLLPATAGAG